MQHARGWGSGLACVIYQDVAEAEPRFAWAFVQDLNLCLEICVARNNAKGPGELVDRFIWGGGREPRGTWARSSAGSGYWWSGQVFRRWTSGRARLWATTTGGNPRRVEQQVQCTRTVHVNSERHDRITRSRVRTCCSTWLKPSGKRTYGQTKTWNDRYIVGAHEDHAKNISVSPSATE
jgi:hypothetical protein